MKMLKVKVKYHTDIEPLEKISSGDWIDLRCAEDTFIGKGEYAQIPLGVSIQLPFGYEAIVAPRSSLFRKHGLLLANSIGVIDERYCGDDDQWHFLAYCAMAESDVMVNGRSGAFIPKGERICQFRIIEHQPGIEFETVDTLGNESRGGIGSTGRF